MRVHVREAGNFFSRPHFPFHTLGMSCHLACTPMRDKDPGLSSEGFTYCTNGALNVVYEFPEIGMKRNNEMSFIMILNAYY